MADRDGPDGSQRRSLIALGVVVVLFLVGWLLAHELYASGKLEDCLMSGRTNCVPWIRRAADSRRTQNLPFCSVAPEPSTATRVT